MGKTLKFVKLSLRGCNVIGRILQQSHRGSEFGRNGECSWLSPDYVLFTSSARPEYDERQSRSNGAAIEVFVCGGVPEGDTDCLVVPANVWDRVVRAAGEYEAAFRDSASAVVPVSPVAAPVVAPPKVVPKHERGAGLAGRKDLGRCSHGYPFGMCSRCGRKNYSRLTVTQECNRKMR